jgi:hypothetical protein
LRDLELPQNDLDWLELAHIVRGQKPPPAASITEADVSEALAALKRPCTSKSELRYQLAAAVVLNSWIESERALGFRQRKKFYAFKERVGALADWAAQSNLDGVIVWAELNSNGPLLFIRIDDVDFSFQAIPGASSFVKAGGLHSVGVACG